MRASPARSTLRLTPAHFALYCAYLEGLDEPTLHAHYGVPRTDVRVNRRGGQWWRSVPRVGGCRARVLVACPPRTSRCIARIWKGSTKRPCMRTTACRDRRARDAPYARDAARHPDERRAARAASTRRTGFTTTTTQDWPIASRCPGSPQIRALPEFRSAWE